MADNLLGHNPMANTSSTSKNLGGDVKKKNGPIIGVDSNTEGGGVWAQTNAKRDKLGELKLELKWDEGQRTLDDAASDGEKLDLYLADGINAVLMLVDGKEVKNINIEPSVSKIKMPPFEDFYSLLEDFEASLDRGNGIDDLQINQQQFDGHISKLIECVDKIRLHHAGSPHQSTEISLKDDDNPSPSTQSNECEQSSLVHIRDIKPFILPRINGNDTESTNIPDELDDELYSPISSNLEQCTEYFRVLLLQSCLQHLSTQWEDIVKISDADLDRAATTGSPIPQTNTMSIQTLHQVLDTFAQGTCQDRVKALWALMDKDRDNLINQSEMDKVAYMSIAPVGIALKDFVHDCLEVWPVRSDLPTDYLTDLTGKNSSKGRYRQWKENRREKKTKKVVLRLLDRAIQKHFEIDVEVPHRLRCCYAWAHKMHQNGKVESILVDGSEGSASTDGDVLSSSPGSGFLSGVRKRYVELDPKISYQEFRDVQKEHFSHLDRVGEELCTSFKEELWIHQGTRRQNVELKRESAAFLAVVSLIDLGIFLA